MKNTKKYYSVRFFVYKAYNRKTAKTKSKQCNTCRFSDECGLVVRHDEADDNLECEPDVTDALDVEERRVRVFPLLFHRPPGGTCRPGLVAGGRRKAADVVEVDVEGDVAQDGDSQAVVRLETERQDGRDDEEHGHAGDHLQQHSFVRPVNAPGSQWSGQVRSNSSPRQEVVA